MDLERNLSSGLDDPEPSWGDEDAAPRAGSLWLARARACSAPTEVHGDVAAQPLAVAAQAAGSAHPPQAMPAADVVPAPDDVAWFAPEPEAVDEEDAFDLVHGESADSAPATGDDTSWFVVPELAPGAAGAFGQAEAVTGAAQATAEFPPAWFPGPEPPQESAPGQEPVASAELAAVRSAALARFEAGQPLPADEPVGDPSLSPAHEVHAWFPSSQAFLDTLSAEAASVLQAAPAEELLTAEAQACEPMESLEPIVACAPEPATASETSESQAPDAAYSAAAPAVDASPYDVSPAVARWRAAQEASLDAWVAAATRTIEGWPTAEAALGPGEEPASDRDRSDVSPADDVFTDVESVPLVDEADAPASVVPVAPEPRPAAVSAGVRARQPVRRLAALLAAGVAGVAVVSTILLPKASVWQPSREVAPPAPAAARVVSTAAPAVAAAVPVAAPRADVPAVLHAGPAWHETKEWTGGRKKSVAFELAAEQPVRMWMRHVTPVLVVRCLNGTLDAFVVTQSPSALEPGRTDHTVRLAFDDGSEAEERWVDSAEHDGLFAPDGRAVLARAARSGRLRFTFRPHNAPTAEASFQLAGLETLQTPLTKFCQ